MEIFSIRIKRTERLSNGTLYMEFEPENMELLEKVLHGRAAVIINGSIAETINVNEMYAALEMMEIIERMYPAAYVLAAKYNG